MRKCSIKGKKQSYIKPLRAWNRAEGWTVNPRPVPCKGFCDYWMHAKWFTIVPFLSPSNYLTCSTAFVDFLAWPIIQFSRHAWIFWGEPEIHTSIYLPVKEGSLSVLEVRPNALKTQNNMVSHLVDIQGQSYNSGFLARFVCPGKDITFLHWWYNFNIVLKAC